MREVWRGKERAREKEQLETANLEGSGADVQESREGKSLGWELGGDSGRRGPGDLVLGGKPGLWVK